MPEAPTDYAANRRARKWRLLALLAGLSLASSFFMPAVHGCNAPIIPANELHDALGDALPFPAGLAEIWDYAVEHIALFLVYGAAYLFGAAAAAVAVIRWRRGRRIEKLWDPLALGLLLIFIAIGVIFIVFREMKSAGWPPGGEWFGFMIIGGACVLAPASLIYVVAAFRLKGRITLCLSFVGAIGCMWWFMTWFVPGVSTNDIYYGLYVSTAASVLLLIAVVGEAAVLTGQSWLRTLGQLLICRLAPFHETKGHCPGCDYYLYGLTEQRCPECGRPFTFEELGATPAELGFAEDSPRRSGL